MGKIKITQIKSTVRSCKRQIATMQALGILRMNQCVEHEATPQILGMVEKVKHLVKIEEL